MSSISKTICKNAARVTKLGDLTPVQSILVKSLMSTKYSKLRTDARLAADRDLEFDRDDDVSADACELNISEVPAGKRVQFSDAFGDALVIDSDTISFSLDKKWDSEKKRTDGVTVREYEEGECVSSTFVPNESNEPKDGSPEDEEMVAVPYACGKGVTMHAWVPKKVAGDMMGH